MKKMVKKLKMMNNIEDYRNVIELLKQALKFYANPDNYKCNKPMGGELYSSVELDGGVQANFALDKAEDVLHLSENLENELVKNLSSAFERGESVDAMLKMIDDFKKMNETLDNISNDYPQSKC